MDINFTATPFSLLLAVLAGYVLGSLPVAQLVSRRYGVDIFSSGTGLAGASNVYRCVGRGPALVVFAGDVVKGAATVRLGQFLGVENPWLLLPAAAAIVGHWNSIFSRFRGGDGLATLGGVAVALYPSYAFIGIAVAMLVSLGAQKMSYTSLLSVVFGYATFATLGLVNGIDSLVILGLGVLCVVVLAHASIGHLRRRRGRPWQDSQEPDAAAEHTGLQP